MIFADSTLLVHAIKEIMTENQAIISHYVYPDPGSNRDGLLHRCLRPARLPIPPSGQVLFSFGSRRTLQVVRDLDGHKGSDFFYYRQLFELGFA